MKAYAPNLVQYPVPAQSFDPWDEGIMHDICGERLGPVVADLLIAYRQVLKTNGSFGADDKKTVEFLMPKLAALQAKCEEEWRDQ